MGEDATALLMRLAGGHELARSGGGWRQAGRRVPDGCVQALVREELLSVSETAGRLTELGRLHVERALSPDRPQQWAVSRGHAGRERVVEDLAENPLGWLLRRELIGPRQFRAGGRLRSDYLAASRSPSVTMRWSGMPRGGAGPRELLDPTEAQIAAKQRFTAACAAVGGGLTSVLERVVCLGEGLATAERALGWPARAGKVVLGIALDRLAEHYGLEP